jgi:hypothetical protein
VIKKKICLVAHDAGGAELISNWSLKKKNIIFSIKGPAIRIFRNNIGTFKNYSFSRAVKLSSTVICGTGNYEYEKKCMLISIRKKKNLIVWLDNWTNYRKRFYLKKKIIIPNEVWVNDNYSRKKIKKIIKTKIVIKKNEYLENQKIEIKKYKNKKKLNFLYLAGLIFDKKINNYSTIEIKSIKNFFNKILKLKKKSKKHINVIIRIHPAENKKKFLLYFSSYKFRISSTRKLITDLLWSSHVFGANTYAMYVAKNLGLKPIYCHDSKKNQFLNDIKMIKLN